MMVNTNNEVWPENQPYVSKEQAVKSGGRMIGGICSIRHRTHDTEKALEIEQRQAEEMELFAKELQSLANGRLAVRPESCLQCHHVSWCAKCNDFIIDPT